MLSNLKKMLDTELEKDDINDMMLEATDSLADMFIDEDGEAEIDESELNDILNKIPEYDEEKELNKKIARIAESYIPEELGIQEAIFVNKFKKEMTLYHGCLNSTKVLEPSFPSVGNKIEKQSGKAVFFFSTKEEALKYAIGKGIEKEFYEFSKFITKHVKEKVPEHAQKGVNDYIGIIGSICLGFQVPTVYHTYNTKLDYYALDDAKINPAFPLCNMFLKWLSQADRKIYVSECVCNTKDIKHGHSKDFREFTVFKNVPVKVSHEYDLTTEFNKLNITYLTTADEFNQYSDLLFTKKHKDLFRSIIMDKDWDNKLDIMLAQESYIPEIFDDIF